MLLEIVLTLIALGGGLTLPPGATRFLCGLPRPVFRLGKRRRTAIVVVGALSLFLIWTLGSIHLPIPAAHDEFCYLLGADTFAGGRFTNPTHTMWRHFETFHTIHQPTYQMKYPVGQSLFLALGQLVWQPILGVWISLALAISAVCWALQGWMPSRWAFVGSLLCLLNINLQQWWGQSYWGGAVAMLGGALLFGALPRLQRSLRLRDACMMGLGLALLANTRPYEGLIASLPVAIVMGGWMVGSHRPAIGMFACRLALPILALLTITAGLMGLYNFKVTGCSFRMPYQVWQSQYVSNGFSEILLGSDTHREQGVATYWLPTQGENGETPYEIPLIESNLRTRLLRQWAFYIRPLLTLPFAIGLFHAGRNLRVPVIGLVMVCLAIGWQDTLGNPHYAAPVACLYWLMAAHGMRCMRARLSCFGARGGAIAILILVCLLLLAPYRLAAYLSEPVAPFDAWSGSRAQMIRELEMRPGNDLVVVRYEPGHHPFQEWVYNQADIDSAAVVWARELDSKSNAQLLEYFHDRQIWLLEADAQPPRVIPHRRVTSGRADSEP